METDILLQKILPYHVSELPADIGLLRAEDVARYFGVQGQTLRNWRTAGLGPAYIKVDPDNPRSQVLYRAEDINSWIEENRVCTQDSRLASETE